MPLYSKQHYSQMPKYRHGINLNAHKDITRGICVKKRPHSNNKKHETAALGAKWMELELLKFVNVRNEKQV